MIENTIRREVPTRYMPTNEEFSISLPQTKCGTRGEKKKKPYQRHHPTEKSTQRHKTGEGYDRRGGNQARKREKRGKTGRYEKGKEKEKKKKKTPRTLHYHRTHEGTPRTYFFQKHPSQVPTCGWPTTITPWDVTILPEDPLSMGKFPWPGSERVT